MYSRKTISSPLASSPRCTQIPMQQVNGTADRPQTGTDAWTEESGRQAAALTSGTAAPAELGLFGEFRRKLAMGEAISRAFARLAEALHFTGRITVSFHQGRVTKTVLEELHIRSTGATGALP